MAAKGTEAKEKLIKSFIEASGDNYIGISDKKYYFWSFENGEKVQVAVSLTCPKTPVEIGDSIPIAKPSFSDGFDWGEESGDGAVNAIASPKTTEVSEEEKANIALLMEKLGL